jgi:glutamate synthase (NADPH/NADH) small chain
MKAEPVDKSIGLIGSGPASLSCAAHLAQMGYKTVIYEAGNIPGGLNATGVALYKLRTEDALAEIDLIRGLGVEIKTGVRVGNDISIDTLLERHDALFVGVGLGSTHRLGIPGEDLDGVMDAVAFIQAIKTQPLADARVGRRVLVIGAGNTAIDAASAAKRLGAESVTMIYRRSESEMPAFKHEFDHAKQDGVAFQWQTAPARIKGDHAVRSLQCFRMKLGKPDKSGRRRPIPIENSEFELEADMVLTALGQKMDSEFILSLPMIETKAGRLAADPDTGQTGNPRIFAGGDLVHGAKEVVNAVQAGKLAATGIDIYLSGEEGRNG